MILKGESCEGGMIEEEEVMLELDACVSMLCFRKALPDPEKNMQTLTTLYDRWEAFL